MHKKYKELVADRGEKETFNIQTIYLEILENLTNWK